MTRRLLPALILAVIAGGWYMNPSAVEGIAKRVFSGRTVSHTPGALPEARPGDAIRIASFNIQVFGEEKLSKPDVMRVLAEVVRRFDLVAIQEVRAKGQDVLPKFLAMINSTGATYDYVIGPRLGRTNSKEQYAFIFDQAKLETDREAIYTLDDPDDLLHREPMVAPFRVRGVPTDRAFTFSLVNVHTDPDDVRRELNVMDDVYRAVRSDGRQEDDVILLGDFNADEQYLTGLAQAAGLVWAIQQTPTNTRHSRMLDNFLFNEQATSEYLGRSGVLDLVREFNLTVEEALDVSDHQPIWAEFGLYEGQAGGRVASRADAAAESR